MTNAARERGGERDDLKQRHRIAPGQHDASHECRRLHTTRGRP